MHNKVYETKVDSPPERVWEFHSSAQALQVLTPPNRRVKLISIDNSVRDGALHVMQVWILSIIPTVWKARISQVTPPFGFTDQAEKSPFKFWRHRHDFIPDGEGTLIRDTIDYLLPLGFLGKVMNRIYIAKDLDRLFAFRHQATKVALDSPGPSTP